MSIYLKTLVLLKVIVLLTTVFKLFLNIVKKNNKDNLNTEPLSRKFSLGNTFLIINKINKIPFIPYYGNKQNNGIEINTVFSFER